MQSIETDVVPWALPREEIPITIKWPKDFEFDKIKITLPNTMELRELLNIKDFQKRDNIIEIDKTNVALSSYSSFIGAIVSTIDIPKELKHADIINIEFIKNERSLEKTQVIARIFRPLLEITDYPKKIMLTDSNEVHILPMKLKFVGFGDIEVRIDAILEGKIVSEKQTIINEIIRRLSFVDSKLEEDPSQVKTDEGKNISVDPNYVRDIASEIEKAIEEGQFSLTEMTAEDITEIKKWFEDIRKRKQFFLILYKRVADMMSNIISDLLSTNPSNNVKLDNITKIRAIVKAPAENLQIKIHYSDSMGNNYEPIEFFVILEDKREKKGLAIEMNVSIVNIQNEPYTNVAEMVI